MIRRVMLGVVAAFVAVTVGAGEVAGPIFLRWLVPGSPLDETIAVYWQRAEADQLGAPALVDLGTMLWEKGFPRDAVRLFKRALERDPDLAEAWFRIGLVHHREGEIRQARKAYRRCLKVLTGHGWCNFYLGLLEEQAGQPSDAIHHFRRAFKFAPELADPEFNPEILSSRLALAGILKNEARTRFGLNVPLHYLEPSAVAEVRVRFEPPPPTPDVANAPEAAAPPQSPTPAPTRVRLQPVDGRLRAPAAPPAAAGDFDPAMGPARPPADADVPDGSAAAPRIGPVSPEAAVGIRPRRPGTS